MKKIFVLFLIIRSGSSTLFAQNGVELFGYFESQVMGAMVDNQIQNVIGNKLRVDLAYSPSDRISFAANFDYITYHGKTQWNILDFLSDDITNAIPPDMAPFYILPFEDRNFLDNAYLKLAFKCFDLTVGKQQISLGSGYTWNPTDVFNVKDVLDPTYEQPGHNAVRLDVPLGNATTISAIYSPEDSWEESAKLFQIKTRIPRFDVTLIAIETMWNFHDYTAFDPDIFNFLGQPEKRNVYGGNLEGELFGLGLWAEYAYNEMEVSDNFHEFVIGTNYTFDCQTFVMLEYYRSTLGKTDVTDYTLNDWMRYFAAEQKAISQDQIYALVQHPVSDFIDMGVIGIGSISDGSFALVPTFNWSFSDNLDITAYANMNFGKKGTAYAKDSGSGGLVRARIYF